jgi:chromosome segregation ATPase
MIIDDAKLNELAVALNELIDLLKTEKKRDEARENIASLRLRVCEDERDERELEAKFADLLTQRDSLNERLSKTNVSLLKTEEERDEAHIKLTAVAYERDILREAATKISIADITDDVRNLLARIHCDGGHHTAEHGLAKSIKDAEAVSVSRVKERDELKVKLAEVEAQAAVMRCAVDAWLNYAMCLCDGMPRSRLDREFDAALAASKLAISPDAGRNLIAEVKALMKVKP